MFRISKFFRRPSTFLLAIFLIASFIFRNSLTTLAAAPIVTTGSASSITKTTATLNGSITNAGGEFITETGFEYGLDTNYGNSTTSFLGSHTYFSQFGTLGSGDGQFNGPNGIAIDLSGNIYVTDVANGRVQKFDSSGTYISQFGSPGSGNGQFSLPQGIKVDSLGNIYVSDTANHRIQKFDSSGTYVSQFGIQGSGDGEFESPWGIAIDSLGNIYVADNGNNRIQKFDSNGNYILQNGVFNFAVEITIDRLDNIYITDGFFLVEKFDSDLNSLGYLSGINGSGDGEFSSPIGVATDSAGDIYVVDQGNNRVQKFSRSTSSVEITGLTCGTTYHFRAYAENADGTSYGNDNTFTTLACQVPEVTTTGSSNVSTSSATLSGSVKISPVLISTIGFDYGLDMSYGQQATTNYVSTVGSVSGYAVTTDSSGNIYTTNTTDHNVKKFDSSGSHLLTFGTAGSGDGEFNNPVDIEIDSSGNIYVVDRDNSRIQKFDSSGVYVSQFGTAGSGNGELDQPNGIGIDSLNNIYVADSNNNRIQKFDSSGVYVSQFGTAGSGNGQFSYPIDVTMDSSNNIYILDLSNNRVQKFNSSDVFTSVIVTGSWGGVDANTVFLDSDQNIYVSGANMGAVEIYNSSGTFLGEITGSSLGSGGSGPTDIHIDNNGNLFALLEGSLKKFNSVFSSPVTSVECGKTYHFRAFATNAEGTGYGDDMTFSTPSCGGGGNGGGPTPVYGCTDSTAENYNSNATVDDGSCEFWGCMDRDATNFDSTANVPVDDYCIYDPGAIPGCTDSTAGNYNSSATVDNGSCLYGVFGCMDPLANNYNNLAEYSNGSCTYDDGPSVTSTGGCTNSGALNYNPNADYDDGTCSYTVPLVYGCVDVSAVNFDSSANTDDGSCSYIGVPDTDVFGEVVSAVSQTASKIPEEILIGVSVVGIVAPGLLLNFLQPGLLAGLVSIPIRLWNLIPVLMGYKRRKRPWGTVYDSVTKQPLDPVYVTLNDSNGGEQGSSITDLDGRYGFLAPAGTYTINAKKDNYIFPSQKLANKKEDDLYGDLYFGGPVTLNEKEGVVYKNIPMDAINFNWNEFAKSENKKLMKFYSKRDLFFARIANTLFIVGLVSSILLFFVNANVLNSIILTFYGLIILLRIFGIKPKQAGRAYDSDGTPLSYGIIRLFSAALGREVAHTIIGKTGRYYMLVPNGQYYMKVSKKTGEDTYQELLTTEEFGVKGGYVSRKISI